jgi:hypothetical protein
VHLSATRIDHETDTTEGKEREGRKEGRKEAIDLYLYRSNMKTTEERKFTTNPFG